MTHHKQYIQGRIGKLGTSPGESLGKAQCKTEENPFENWLSVGTAAGKALSLQVEKPYQNRYRPEGKPRESIKKICLSTGTACGKAFSERLQVQGKIKKTGCQQAQLQGKLKENPPKLIQGKTGMPSSDQSAKARDSLGTRESPHWARETPGKSRREPLEDVGDHQNCHNKLPAANTV